MDELKNKSDEVLLADLANYVRQMNAIANELVNRDISVTYNETQITIIGHPSYEQLSVTAKKVLL